VSAWTGKRMLDRLRRVLACTLSNAMTVRRQVSTCPRFDDDRIRRPIDLAG